jgi:hypothetical protein
MDEVQKNQQSAPSSGVEGSRPVVLTPLKCVATLMCSRMAYVAGAHRECDEAEGGWPRT